MRLTECFSLEKGQRLYVGNPLTHDDATPAEIERVTLYGSNRVDVNGAYVVPTDTVGSGGSIVHHPAEEPRWHWDRRGPAVGATVAQGAPPTAFILKLSTRADRGTSEGIEIRYRMGSRAYVSRWPTKFELRTKGKSVLCDASTQ